MKIVRCVMPCPPRRYQASGASSPSSCEPLAGISRMIIATCCYIRVDALTNSFSAIEKEIHKEEASMKQIPKADTARGPCSTEKTLKTEIRNISRNQITINRKVSLHLRAFFWFTWQLWTNFISSEWRRKKNQQRMERGEGRVEGEGRRSSRKIRV